mgnify:CR=1 FL=1
MKIVKASSIASIIFTFFLSATQCTSALGAGPTVTQQNRLQSLAEKLHERSRADRQQTAQYAARAGIPTRRELPGGKVLELQRIAPGLGPVFYITNNIGAADTVSTDDVWPGGIAGLNLEGAGLIVGEWDGGAVHPGHPDILNIIQVDGATEISGHATHVAGTLVGSGASNPAAHGMAAAAQLNAWDWNDDTAEMATAAAGGLLVSNHSYGAATGWVYIGDSIPNEWWWIGGDGDEDPKFGYYDLEAQLWDQVAYDAPTYLAVKAAGNDRTDIGPNTGEAYTIIDDNGTPLATSTQPRPADCAPTGYDCLPLHSVAKNILTVGAVDDLPDGYSPLAGPGQVSMAPFSSWGPTDDGRIKPDLAANGVLLLSTWIDEHSPYAVASGTSMASPSVTGSLLLLQEHYADLHGTGNFMRSATLKALAIHTADEAGSADGPDYEYGWGLLNTRKAAELISDAHVGVNHQVIEGSLQNGSTDPVPVQVPGGNSIIRATLVWMDPPGTPAPPSLDPTDPMLVNDLDLRVIDGTTLYEPWVLDPAVPAAAATQGDNFRDNVEQVVTGTLGAGSYTVEITHKGQLTNGAQDYALIISVLPEPPTASGTLFDVDFSGGLPGGWSIQTQWGKAWEIISPVAGDDRLDNFTGGNGEFAIVDNNYTYRTLTSLQTPILNLSGYTGAVLSFNSCFAMDYWETINVDASTDGGQAWSNVWTRQGFQLCPSQYSLDLSSLAGNATVMLRWRFDSGPDTIGNLWQIDNLRLEGLGGGSDPGSPPGTAGNPTPTNGATGIDINQDLVWAAAVDADSHDVYFGTNPSPGTAEFQGNQTATTFDPGELTPSSTYYWRIDEVNAHGTTQGMTWNFQTANSAPDAIIFLDDLSADSSEAPRGRWDAAVTVGVIDAEGQAVSGVVVDGSWSDGANGASSCTTDALGSCTVTKPNLKNNVSSVVYSVNNLSLSGYTYDSDANLVPPIVAAFKPEPNLLPVAVDDSYSTSVDTLLAENVMTNDTAGEAPTAVTSWGNASNGAVVGSADGGFTYTPDSGFSGTDIFGYTITDANGDSASATVTVTVGDSAATRTLNLSKSKSKGNNIVTLTWAGFTGTVSIHRNGVQLADNEPAEATWQDNLGKGISGTYEYQVCDTECATASVFY